MHRATTAGLKCRQVLPKVISSCLGEKSRLPYNWSEKLRAFVLGIAFSRSVRLQDIARTQSGPIKTVENKLSSFLSQEQMRLDEEHRRYIISILRRLGSKRFVRYQGKLVLFIDTTSYAKIRSRGDKRPMPRTGKVRLHNLPTDDPILVPGYQEIWAGLLLKNGRCLGITRKLFTEKMEFFASQNTLEEMEIRHAIQLVKEAFQRDVILVADRGFKRKDLLHWLKEMENVDFIIRIDGKLTVKMGGWDGLLGDLIVHQPQRRRIFWREDTKRAVLCDVHAGKMRMKAREGSVDLYAVCLTPLQDKKSDPIFLATSLPMKDQKTLSWIVKAYSARWTIETFFFDFKQSLGTGDFRVFSCWEAIDRLLAMAHMAFLALLLVYLMMENDPRRRRLLRIKLRFLFARPPELTLGRFMEWIVMDFEQYRWVEAL
jgi:Transposase DDE domain